MPTEAATGQPEASTEAVSAEQGGQTTQTARPSPRNVEQGTTNAVADGNGAHELSTEAVSGPVVMPTEAATGQPEASTDAVSAEQGGQTTEAARPSPGNVEQGTTNAVPVVNGAHDLS